MKSSLLKMETKCAQRFLPAKEKLWQLVKESNKSTLVIAIEGKCASGKTTLGYYLKEFFDCNLLHMDDFFLQPSQRTPERLEEVGGNVDYERFSREVLAPLLEGKEIFYKPYSCKEQQLLEGFWLPAKRINIIEGSYSLHPYFKAPYDLKIFTDIDEVSQLENIRRRNGEEKLRRFMEEWIPKENAYFSKFNVKAGCLTIKWNSKHEE